METLIDLLNFIISPEIRGALLVLKIFCLIFSLFAIVFIVWVLAIRTDWLNWWLVWDLKEFFTLRPYGLKKVTKKWEKIKKRLEAGSEEEYKLAVIEADALLNKCLRDLQIGLETLEETLRKRIGSDTISNIEEVKEAHRIRNQIVWQPDFKLDLEKARELLAIYEKALEEITIL